jgi:hypothetical protein
MVVAGHELGHHDVVRHSEERLKRGRRPARPVLAAHAVDQRRQPLPTGEVAEKERQRPAGAGEADELPVVGQEHLGRPPLSERLVGRHRVVERCHDPARRVIDHVGDHVQGDVFDPFGHAIRANLALAIGAQVVDGPDAQAGERRNVSTLQRVEGSRAVQQPCPDPAPVAGGDAAHVAQVGDGWDRDRGGRRIHGSNRARGWTGCAPRD